MLFTLKFLLNLLSYHHCRCQAASTACSPSEVPGRLGPLELTDMDWSPISSRLISLATIPVAVLISSQASGSLCLSCFLFFFLWKISVAVSNSTSQRNHSSFFIGMATEIFFFFSGFVSVYDGVIFHTFDLMRKQL